MMPLPVVVSTLLAEPTTLAVPVVLSAASEPVAYPPLGVGDVV